MSRDRLATLIAGVRRILGMPDYAAYCAHVRQAHPGTPVPTEREYFDVYLKARYEGGPNRCC
jgi:uncharacterized short protein YbdD (DUF466 family)